MHGDALDGSGRYGRSARSTSTTRCRGAATAPLGANERCGADRERHDTRDSRCVLHGDPPLYLLSGMKAIALLAFIGITSWFAPAS